MVKEKGDIRIKITLSPFYGEIYRYLHRKKFFSRDISKNFFLCFFCNPFLKEKNNSKFIYEVFKNEFVHREIELDKLSPSLKEAIYTVEDGLILSSVKREIELIIWNYLSLYKKDYEKIRYLLQEKGLRRTLKLESFGLRFHSNAGLIRFLLLVFGETLKNREK